MHTESAISAGHELESQRQLLDLWQAITDQLAQLFLKNHIVVPELERILRQSMVVAALDAAGADVNDDLDREYARIAFQSGLPQSDVADIARKEALPLPPEDHPVHVLIRIMAAWRNHPDYQDEAGHPVDLPMTGKALSFQSLCAEIDDGGVAPHAAEALLGPAE
jgi:hypothetical protein